MNRKIIAIISIIFSLFFCSYVTRHKKELSVVEQTNTFPKQIGLLNDFEGDFTIEQKKELKQVISNFQKSTSKSIIVVSIETFAPYDDLKKFTVDLGNNWKLKNTVLIVFSKNKRKIALSITSDVTGLSDSNGQNIVSEIIIPEFKKNNFYHGIRKGTDTFIKKWK